MEALASEESEEELMGALDGATDDEGLLAAARRLQGARTRALGSSRHAPY